MRGAARSSSRDPGRLAETSSSLRTLCLGSGAVRYRATLERMGAEIPDDGDGRHLPRAALHAALAGELGPVDDIEPVYVRLPDAELPRA